MKIRIEICEQGEEEIIIRTRNRDERVCQIEDALCTVLKNSRELTLYSGGAEFFVPISELLFFETSEGRVYAHTRESVYTAPYKLFELEDVLPSCFVRISKSTIANVKEINSITREVVGNGVITFSRCAKKTYFSRSYYKIMRDRIEEIKLS